MSDYIRVIPRDLFNEANLLKCLGQLALHIHDYKYPTNPEFELPVSTDGFQIEMHIYSGDLFVANLPLTIEGRVYDLTRPINSRQPWPLWISSEDLEEPFEVFQSDGSISILMAELLSRGLDGYRRLKSAQNKTSKEVVDRILSERKS